MNERMSGTITVYTDGAARGNPGESASGFMIYDSSGKLRKSSAVYNGSKTNNYAEYMAVIEALEWCKAHLKAPNDSDIMLFSDSQLVVRQLNGDYKVKAGSLAALHKRALALAKSFNSVTFSNLPRENANIGKVDRMLNELLDGMGKEKG